MDYYSSVRNKWFHPPHHMRACYVKVWSSLVTASAPRTAGAQLYSSNEQQWRPSLLNSWPAAQHTPLISR